MNIAIIGYGKMGKEVELTAMQKGIAVKSIIDSQNPDAMYRDINEQSLHNIDVAIDFTHPKLVMENIKKVSSHGKNLVIGTTGWYDQVEEVKHIIEKSGTGAIWSGNFSLGVNIFFRMITCSAEIINKFANYDVFVHEVHHREKADSPSGTATMIGNILLEHMKRKHSVVTDELQRKINPEELHISSTRGGFIPGTHTVSFDSMADTIELKHTARGRQGFATGAILAAEWINNKIGFFGIEDMMSEIITYGE